MIAEKEIKRRKQTDSSKSPESAHQRSFSLPPNRKQSRSSFLAFFLLGLTVGVMLAPSISFTKQQIQVEENIQQSSNFALPPPESEHLLYCNNEYEFSLIIDAFEKSNYRQTQDQSKALFIYQWPTKIDKDALQKWQRPSLFPGSWVFATKTKVLSGLKKHNQQLSQQSPKKHLPFLMESYVLGVREDRASLLSKLENDGGMDIAWVKKQPGVGGGGKGVSSLAPNSKELKELKSSIENYDHSSMKRIIVQKMMSNLLLHRGRKFHIRAHFLIASIDPLAMFYHDGYLVISLKKFDANDYSKSNLVDNLHFFESWEGFKNLTKEEKESRSVTFEDFARDDLMKYTKENPALSKISNPGEHIRSQMKSAIATTMDVFRPYFSKSGNSKEFPTDNSYALLGVDFFVDDSLGVKLIEVNTMLAVDNRTEAKQRLYPPMFSGMVQMISQVYEKQKKGENVLPIEPAGGWELIFTDDYQFEYEFDM